MDIEEQIRTMKAEIDSLQIQAAEKSRPWFHNPSLLLSIFALVFSFGTTVFSYKKGHDEDVRANRKEVREILQRLTRLPIENFDLLEKYKGNPSGEALGGMINQELLVLTAQAAERVKRFPKSFTSTEYFAIATALGNSGNMNDVPLFLKKAIDLATTANDYSVASRAYGHMLMTQGKIDEGREYYAQAVTGVWAKFPSTDPFLRKALELQGKLNQVSSELTIGDKPAARRCVEEAKAILSSFPDSPAKGYWVRQFEATARMAEQYAPLDRERPAVP